MRAWTHGKNKDIMAHDARIANRAERRRQQKAVEQNDSTAEYRTLEIGEIMREGDEWQDTDGRWRPVTELIGEKVIASTVRRPISLPDDPTENYVDQVLKPLHDKISELEQDNARLREALRQTREPAKHHAVEATAVPAGASATITNDGMEFLATIRRLQGQGWAVYRRWYLNSMGEVWWASKEEYLMRSPDAIDLVAMVQAVEDNHAVDDDNLL